MSLRNQSDDIEHEMDRLRQLAKFNSHDKCHIPITLVSDMDPDQIELIQGEFVHSPWNNMMVMLALVDSENCSKTLICRCVDAVDCEAHKHEDHVEEIFVIEGTMEDKANDIRIHAGGRAKYAPGQVHWPTFPGPATIVVVFRKVR